MIIRVSSKQQHEELTGGTNIIVKLKVDIAERPWGREAVGALI